MLGKLLRLYQVMEENAMVSKIHPHWKNPYNAKRKGRDHHQAEPNTSQARATSTTEKASNTSNLDILPLISNFQDGVKGISSSIQQFEQTMESLTQLYQTIDKLGGFKRLSQIVSPTTSTRAASRQTTDLSNVYGHLQSFIGMLQKVDFNQINHFLESTIVQDLVNDNRPKK